MRLSTIQGDPGYKNDREIVGFKVFLDGVQLFDCIIADEEKGIVQRVSRTLNPFTRRYHVHRKWTETGVVVIKR